MVRPAAVSRLLVQGIYPVLGAVTAPAAPPRRLDQPPRLSLRLCGDGASASDPVPFGRENRTKYRYDGADQLTGVKYGATGLDGAHDYDFYTLFDRQQTWEYDGVGSRKTMVDAATGGATDTWQYNRATWGGAYAPDSVNRYVNIWKNAVQTARGHDANGNLTDDGTYTYTYNCNNQLMETRLKSDNSLVQGNNYNCFGIRIFKDLPAPATDVYFYTDGPRVVEERDASEAVLATYVYGDWIDEVLTMTRGGATYYYSQQALYSVVYISDAAGGNVEKMLYDGFGGPTFYHWIPPFIGGGGTWNAVSASLIGNPFAFTGRDWDPETKAYYYRARYMDPVHGRFTTRDPISCRGALQDLYNQYTYVQNRATGFVDPFGLYDYPDPNGPFYEKWIWWLFNRNLPGPPPRRPAPVPPPVKPRVLDPLPDPLPRQPQTQPLQPQHPEPHPQPQQPLEPQDQARQPRKPRPAQDGCEPCDPDIGTTGYDLDLRRGPRPFQGAEEPDEMVVQIKVMEQTPWKACKCQWAAAGPWEQVQIKDGRLQYMDGQPVRTDSGLITEPQGGGPKKP